jgi:hypothetical protein
MRVLMVGDLRNVFFLSCLQILQKTPGVISYAYRPPSSPDHIFHLDRGRDSHYRHDASQSNMRRQMMRTRTQKERTGCQRPMREELAMPF